MAKTINQRMTVDVEGDFVVFLIGMRINSFWKFHKWVPVAQAMPRMLRELSGKPESGFLGFQMYGGLPPVIAQYWRSFEQLEAYAKDRDGAHYPAWKDFNQKVRKSGEVGIWHETFKVRTGEYECIYSNMPKYGLGKVGKIVPAVGSKESSAQRISPK
ncbi:DUF4188 domain-containing protein [Rufibacter hautae]|uniref:DUF4188 domain-containing protein n=1 Tax=Rufibacter hautae TaxID=2595005 RepID=A0A5B6TF92_9BACT|nr:DUF4188 domain-containing protein [Rufibacter hautae]KAA3437940.1 DUF4188 domain-containing protein [Rufibacter hautae]